jgi:DNA-directed RNA polymerase specialized sigma24 family protein
METVTTDVAQESSGTLLRLMQAGDQDLVRDAQQEFHKRHYGYLLNVLRPYAEGHGSVVVGPDEFALRTLLKAFNKSRTFEDTGENGEDTDRKVRAWLGRIANSLALDELRKQHRQLNCVPLNGWDETRDKPVPSEVPDINPTNPEALNALKEALDRLSERDRDVLMTYANSGIRTPNGRELSKEDREALELRTGYSRSCIRQKWHRLSQLLKETLQFPLSNQKHSHFHE